MCGKYLLVFLHEREGVGGVRAFVRVGSGKWKWEVGSGSGSGSGRDADAD